MKKLVLLTLLTVLAVSCDPKKKDSTRVNANNTNIVTNLGACTSTQQQYGTIYSAQGGGMDMNFRNNVLGFMSSYLTVEDLNQVGTISSADKDQTGTGVRFIGTVKLDQNGNVMTSQSTVNIIIYDSLTVQNPNYYQPIQNPFTGASEGRFNMQTGVGYVVFKDPNGEVRFDGTLNAQTFSGTVSYRNYKSATSQNQPAQGQLGQFYVVRCGFIQ